MAIDQFTRDLVSFMERGDRERAIEYYRQRFGGDRAQAAEDVDWLARKFATYAALQHPADLELRWLEAGRSLRREHVERFMTHLLAMESAIAREVEAREGENGEVRQ